MDEDRHGWQEDGGEFPLWLAWALAGFFATIAGLLLLLHVELRHNYPTTRPHVVTVTPHTYGPSPAMLRAVMVQ